MPTPRDPAPPRGSDGGDPVTRVCARSADRAEPQDSPDQAAGSREGWSEEERRRATWRVERDLEELGDPEGGPALPSATLAWPGHREPDDPSLRPAPFDARRPSRELLRLAWPVMLSQVLMNAAMLVDRAMIGRLADGGGAAVPLAAVGYATQLFFLIQSTLFAISLACVALMARAIGAGRPAQARRALAASVQVAVAVTAVLAGSVLAFAEPLLGLLGAEPAVVAAALPYLRWVIGSSLLLAVTLVLENALRANRDTLTPMLVAGVVTAVKLAGNALLIFGLAGAPRLGLTGAGLATALSQVVGLAAFAFVVLRMPASSPLHVRGRDWWARTPLRREVLRIALPGIAERVVMNFALLSYFWVLSSHYGTLAVAAYAVGVPLLSFSWIPGQGYAQACATLVGQALGAGHPELATRTGWRSAALALSTAVVLGVFCLVAAETLARLFTDDAAVIAEVVPFLGALAVAQPFLQLHFTLGGAHRGAGDTWTPMIAASVGNWLFRVPLSLLFAGVLGLGVVWVWYAILFDHVARAAWLAWSFRRGRWRSTLAPV